MTPEQEDRLDAILEQIETRAKTNSPLSVEEACRECPDLIREVYRRLEAQRRFESLLTDDRTAGHEAWLTSPGYLRTTTPAELRAAALLDPPREADELGRIGEYRVLAILGEGGMGIVLRAEEPLPLGAWRPVAIKIIRPDIITISAQRRRFDREVRIAAQLQHERIVQVLRVGMHGGTPYLVMPLLEGETLEARLTRESRLSLPVAVRLARHVLEALQVAHKHPTTIIHRDVKPSNIWIKTGSGAALLMDFGLARSNLSSDELTPPRQGVGTLHYVSLEQARGDQPDHRADLYSVGVVLYRALTGRLPFEGTQPMRVLLALMNSAPPAPDTLVPTIPPGLSALVLQLLQLDRDARPNSAGEVIASLRPFA